jgi:hypothetical protein
MRGPPCRGFVGLPLARPTRVMVVSDAAAEALRDVVVDGLRDAFVGLGASQHECSGPGDLGCWATNEPAARNILVLVTESSPPSLEIEQLLEDWVRRGLEPFAAVPATTGPDAVLPRAMRTLNAFLWRSDPREVLPEIVDTVVLDAEDRRIFISYARIDGSATAERVFEDLRRLRFDVFLDRFRIEPGADVLVRIQDEILDKWMVVVIETPAALRSDWVRQQVNVAAARRLGLAAVNLGRSETIREIDPCETSFCVAGADPNLHCLGFPTRIERSAHVAG